MDIAALSTALSQAKVAGQASIAVTKLAMDSSQVSMENTLKTLEQSVNPHLGGNIDIKL